jgi:benzodiazapine receptor
MSSTRFAELARSGGGATFLGFSALTSLTALAGAEATREGLSPWYDGLNKPPFQPPAWLFAPVWTVLYGLIAASGSRIYARPPSPARRRALGLWAAQLGLNGLWSWLFFARRRPRAALVDCALLLATAGAYVKVAHGVDRKAAWLFVPYVGWVAFATLLNEEIVRRNPLPDQGFGAGGGARSETPSL